jgi:hypothetical protein
LFGRISVGTDPSDEYRTVVDKLRRLTEPLQHVRMLHIAELNKVGTKEIPLLWQESMVMIHQDMPNCISMELLEEMWRSRPFINGRRPRAQAALTDGCHALLADSPIDQPEAIIALLDQPKVAARLDRTTHDAVANNYLATYHLADYLKLSQRLTGRRPSRSKS